MQKPDIALTPQQHKSHKNKYEFQLQPNHKITIDSDFDNGNIGLIRQVTDLHYRLEAISDFYGTGSKKTWFHFRVAAPGGLRIRFSIENINIYDNMYGELEWAKPVINDGQGWKQLKDSFLTYRGQVGIILDHTFTTDNTYVYFAMSVPHSYQDCQLYLKYLKNNIPHHVQYEDQIIAQSYGGLNLHLLRITGKQQATCWKNWGNQRIRRGNGRVHSESTDTQNYPPQIFRSNRKPIILITSRVHPGQVGASYCLMGILDFLTHQSNLQSFLILKLFEILVIPLVNPDGVYQGNYRMDLNNNNLNRVYQDPSPIHHPTIYKIKQVIAALVTPSKQKTDKLLPRKILFHFDLHSHSGIKPAFIYGNAFDEIVAQTESELYCKLLQQNSEIFKYDLSSFRERHMKMKDKGEPLTKQGCARVVFSKMANVIYSYTVQTAIFPYTNHSQLQPPTNTDFHLSDHYGFTDFNSSYITSKYGYRNQLVIDNMLLGHALLISILDLLQKNPYSRQPTIDELLDLSRRELAQNIIQEEERFKQMDVRAYQKVKNIVLHCKEQFTNKYQKYWEILGRDQLFSTIKWPTSFKMWEVTNQGNNCGERDAGKKRIKTDNYTDAQKNVNDNTNEQTTAKNMKKQYLQIQPTPKKPQPQYSKLPHPVLPLSKIPLSHRNIQLYINSLKTSPNTHTSSTYLLSSQPYKQEGTHTTSCSQNKTTPRKKSSKKDIEILNSNTYHENKSIEKNKQFNIIKSLYQKQHTKNIKLSFLLNQLNKNHVTKKDNHYNKTIGTRFTNFKLGKKNTTSNKILLNSKFGKNGISTLHPQPQVSQQPNCKVLIKVLKNEQNTPQKYHRQLHIKQQQEKQYKQQQTIHHQKFQKPNQLSSTQRTSPQKLTHPKTPSPPDRKLPLKINTQSLDKFLQYTPNQSQNDNNHLTATQEIDNNQIFKLKFIECKSRNTNKQDTNYNIKLPQVKPSTNKNKNTNLITTPTTSQSEARKTSNPKKKMSINLNINLNYNLHVSINSNKISGRARSLTVPDQTI